MKICSDNGLKTDGEFDSLELKYTVLKACYDETGHSVPNSLLHTIETVGEIYYFTSYNSLEVWFLTTPSGAIEKNVQLSAIFSTYLNVNIVLSLVVI